MTKNNHYNPCFWTALWNVEYFDNFKINKNIGRAREQEVFVLSYRRPKILKLKTELVHVIKGFALIPTTVQEHNLFLGQYKVISDNSVSNLRNHILVDMEPLFSLIEKYACYHEMLNIVRINGKISNTDKQYLALFITYHKLRSPIYFVELYKKCIGSTNPKLEMFKNFYEILLDESIGENEVIPLLNKAWVYYKLDNLELPYPDNPIIKDGDTIWVILSPKNLIQIDLKNSLLDVEIKENLSEKEYEHLINLIICNSYSEIISTNSKQLYLIQESENFQSRKKLICA